MGQSQTPTNHNTTIPRSPASTLDLGPVESFFAQYPDFDYQKKKPIVKEFYRMCDSFGWNKDDDKQKKAHEEFKTAMVITFNALYGKDVNNIDSWHKLCVALNIVPLPKDLKECRETVEKVHVNLVDLVDTRGKQVEIFESLKDLQIYTIRSGKFFPKESAYAGGVLKALLREILHVRRGGWGGRH